MGLYNSRIHRGRNVPYSIRFVQVWRMAAFQSKIRCITGDTEKDEINTLRCSRLEIGLGCHLSGIYRLSLSDNAIG